VRDATDSPLFPAQSIRIPRRLAVIPVLAMIKAGDLLHLQKGRFANIPTHLFQRLATVAHFQQREAHKIGAHLGEAP